MNIPNGRYNLISVMKIIKQRWKLEGNGDGLSLSHVNKKLTFDKKIHTANGLLYAVKVKPNQEVSAMTLESSKVAGKTLFLKLNVDWVIYLEGGSLDGNVFRWFSVG
jgi:hypothetical protein